MRIWSTQWFGGAVSINTDTVFAAMDLPPSGLLNGAGGEVSVIGSASISTNKGILYDMAGFIAPSPNPETATTYDALWHDYVDKASDNSATILRLDEGANATTPVWEPGEVRWQDLFNMEIITDSDMFYKYRSLMTFAKRPVGWVDSAPDNYVPSDFVRVASSRGRRFVDIPSHAMFGVSVPSVDESAVTLHTPAENSRDWMWLKYAKDMLEFAFAYMINSTDGAGDDPWELATIYLEELISPPIFQPVAAGELFKTSGVDVLGKINFDISVPGSQNIKQISGGA